MARPRKRTPPPPPTDDTADLPARDGPIDVNAIVSYNLKAIRERHGWTQQHVADQLGQLTGHTLPQASISAMERGYDGERRRRFDAHELYLLSEVFDVPIPYFFLPPPGTLDTPLADTGTPAAQIYFAILGGDTQLEAVDERLEELGLHIPQELDPVMAAVLGAPKDVSFLNWHDHFRTWRKKRIDLLAREYGDQLDDIADVLADFAAKLKTLGPRGYLQSIAHKDGEDSFIPQAEPEE
jgi:transcriptional regulator with XRE-family HTH domain